MTEQQSAFLKLLGEYLFEKPSDEDFEKYETELLRLSCVQNMLGICWSALRRRNKSSGVLESCKRAVIARSVLQAEKTACFLRLYRALSECGVKAVCVKGVTLRRLYPEPDLRPSSDEDLIIHESEMKLFSEVCEKCGFTIQTENENQITVYHPNNGLIVEAQKLFFLPGDRISEQMNGFFSESRERLKKTLIDNAEITTLDETDNLLYLICHVLKHYIRSGFGIRQICDILVFCRTYYEEIDFGYVLKKLCEISADGFAADIFEIGRNDFGLGFCLPEAFVGREVDSEKLKADVFSAGVFGKSTAARTHSAALTLSAVKGDESVKKSAAKRAFISFDSLKESYPKLEKRKYLYLYYSFRRLADYFKKADSIPVTKESIEIARERLVQLSSYGLLSGKSETEFDEEVMNAVRKRLESGMMTTLTVTGSSMTPFLVGERDSVELKKIETEPRVGDVVLYRRKNGAYVLHRIVKKDNNGFYFAGDSQNVIEGPIEKNQLIAVCDAFIRKGKRITGKEACWKAYEFLWRKLIGHRTSVMKIYEKMKEQI